MRPEQPRQSARPSLEICELDAQAADWLAHVGMHRRNYRRHHTVYRPTPEAACSTCLAWWAVHADVIAAELPRMVPGPFGPRREYPACNTPGPS